MTETSQSQRFRVGLIIALIVFGAAMRLVPHAWNVAPLGAIALFAGAHFRNKLWALLTPLVALLLSDTIMHFTDRAGFYAGMEFTYLGFVAVVCIGMLIHPHRRPLPVLVASLAGSVTFFVLSNFGSWLTFEMYPKTWQGLMACYLAGLAFYRDQHMLPVLGDLFYAVLLFGIYAWAERALPVASRLPVRQRG